MKHWLWGLAEWADWYNIPPRRFWAWLLRKLDRRFMTCCFGDGQTLIVQLEQDISWWKRFWMWVFFGFKWERINK